MATNFDRYKTKIKNCQKDMCDANIEKSSDFRRWSLLNHPDKACKDLTGEALDICREKYNNLVFCNEKEKWCNKSVPYTSDEIAKEYFQIILDNINNSYEDIVKNEDKKAKSEITRTANILFEKLGETYRDDIRQAPKNISDEIVNTINKIGKIANRFDLLEPVIEYQQSFPKSPSSKKDHPENNLEDNHPLDHNLLDHNLLAQSPRPPPSSPRKSSRPLCGTRRSKSNPDAYTKDELVDMVVERGLLLKTKARKSTMAELCRLLGLDDGNIPPSRPPRSSTS